MSDMDIKNEILVQAGLLQHHIGISPLSVTFHKPVMGKDISLEAVKLLKDQGIYCPNYDSRFKYISDSGHNWREDPIEAILKYPKLHINIHPEWYNEIELTMEECLISLGLELDVDKKVIKEINHIKEYLKCLTK